MVEVPAGIINLIRSLFGKTTSYTLSIPESPFLNNVTLPSPLASLVADTELGNAIKSPVPIAPAERRLKINV